MLKHFVLLTSDGRTAPLALRLQQEGAVVTVGADCACLMETYPVERLVEALLTVKDKEGYYLWVEGLPAAAEKLKAAGFQGMFQSFDEAKLSDPAASAAFIEAMYEKEEVNYEKPLMRTVVEFWPNGCAVVLDTKRMGAGDIGPLTDGSSCLVFHVTDASDCVKRATPEGLRPKLLSVELEYDLAGKSLVRSVRSGFTSALSLTALLATYASATEFVEQMMEGKNEPVAAYGAAVQSFLDCEDKFTGSGDSALQSMENCYGVPVREGALFRPLSDFTSTEYDGAIMKRYYGIDAWEVKE